MFQGGYAVIFKVSLCALLPFALRQIIDLCSSQKRGENLGLNLLLIQREQTIGEETPATWVLFYLFVIVQTLSLLLMIIEILWNSCPSVYIPFIYLYIRTTQNLHIWVKPDGCLFFFRKLSCLPYYKVSACQLISFSQSLLCTIPITIFFTINPGLYRKWKCDDLQNTETLYLIFIVFKKDMMI